MVLVFGACCVDGCTGLAIESGVSDTSSFRNGGSGALKINRVELVY
jgi:hypothetical protein